MRVRLGRRVRRRLEIAAMACAFLAVAGWAAYEAAQPGPWQRVVATREGLTGRRLACGDVIRPGALFVALPHRAALRKNVELRYGARTLVVPVLDVGPWNVDDDYWTAGRRPAAELGRGAFRKPSNPAGIDLSDATFAALGLRDNSPVEWRFVHRGYIPLPRVAMTRHAHRRMLGVR
ncbi:MAG: hypothetical protein ABUS79_19520 [Pseudomonadota bacterium]